MPAFPLHIDLTSLAATDGFVIQGDAAGDYAGIAVSSAGDVNGDGIDDLIVGAAYGDDGGVAAGEAYVVFGTRDGFGVDAGGRQVIDLTTLAAAQGFIVQGDATSDRSGTSVASAGDVNGDGIDDLIVGTRYGDDGGSNAGEAYIIFGTRGGFGADVGGRQVIDLTTLTAAQGFIVQGDMASDSAGAGVASAGDVNGDGIDDLIVGASGGDDGGSNAGEAYVVFGTGAGFGAGVGGRQVIDLTTLTAAQGFIVQGDAANDQLGFAVSSAGDVNGDGIDDLIVGAIGQDGGAGGAGAAYVVFGTRDGFGADVSGRQVIDLATLTAAQGFLMLGDGSADQAGFSVSSAGDIDGDGIDDLIVGSRGGDDGGSNAGEAYVVFGTRGAFGSEVGGQDVIAFASLAAARGFIIQGDAANDQTGFSVASAGDVNGDGIDDLIVGAPYADGAGNSAGTAYVIFGTRQGFGTDMGGRQVLDLTALTDDRGFIVRGEAGDTAGFGVSAAGDVDGDGVDDLIVGAPRGDDGGSSAGEAYVIFGRRANSAPAVTIAASPQGGETLANGVTTGGQQYPVIATLAGGGHVVVWQSYRDGSGYGIYAQRLDASGAPRGGEVLVNTTTGDHQWFPAVAALSGGGYVVTWEGKGPDDAVGIFAQRYDGAGEPQGGEVLVNTTIAPPQTSPVIAGLSDGGYVVAWLSNGQDGSNLGVYLQRHDAAGVAQGSETRVNTVTAGDQREVSVAAFGGGGFVVAWLSSNGSDHSIRVQRYDASGAALGGEIPVNTSAISQSTTAVAALAGGGFVVVWVSSSQDNDNRGIHAQLYDAGGTALGGEVLVNTTIAGLQLMPSVVALGDGGYVVSWTGKGAGDDNGVFTQRYDALGTAIGGETLVNATVPGTQGSPSISPLSDGGYIVTWTGAGPGGGAGVFTQRFEPHFAATEQAGLSLKGAIEIGDTDAGAGVLQATLAVGYGTIAVDAGTSGAAVISGNGTGSVVVEGTLAQLDALLNGDAASSVTYIADTDTPPATTTLTVTVSDQGNTGEGGALSDFATATIAIAAINDAPEVTIAPPLAPAPFGGETRVSTGISNGQFTPTVATLSDGTYVVAWISSGQDGSLTGVYAQRYDAAGLALGGEVRVNSTTAGDQSYAAIVALSDGGYIVAWQSDGQDGSDYGIYAQRYDASGAPQGGEVRVNTTISDYQLQPSIAALADGGYVVAWHSFGQDAGTAGVYAQRYDASGTPQGGEVQVNATSAGEQVYPSVAALAGGGYVVTWMSSGQDGDWNGIYAQRYGASGVAQGGEVRVNATTAGDQGYPSVAALDGGGYVVAWASNGQDGDGYGIYAQRYDAAGAPQGGETLVNTVAAGDQLFPSVAALAGGGYVVAWQSPDGDGEGVHAQRYDALGVAQGGEMLVNTTIAGYQTSVAVAGLASGYLVAWSGAGPAGTSGVFVQRFAPGFAATEQTGLSLKGAIAIGDVDAGTGILQVTLAVDYGIVTVAAGTSGATIVSGNGTMSVTVSGTLAQLEALLNGDPASSVTYLADTDAPPALATLTVTAEDQGGRTASASVPVLLTAVDDIPVAADDRFATDELTVETGNLFADNGDGSDSDADATPLTITAVNGSAANVGAQILLASGALLRVNADGTFTYDPNGAFEHVPAPTSGASNLIYVDSFTYSLGADTASVTIDITGIDNDDLVQGTSGGDLLNGGGGVNTMSYANALAGVTVGLEPAGPQDTGGAGTDTLANFVNLTGSIHADTLSGDSRANTLDGGLGADLLLGGFGDDRYIVDDAADNVREGAGGGDDEVLSSVDYTLPDREVERLTLTGSANLSGGGNRHANILIGNSGANSLAGYAGDDRIDGRGGADVMAGGLGDDVFVVDNIGDRIKERDGEGTDTVEVLVDYTLWDGAVERLVVTGAGAINVTGNAAGNAITGNGAANSLYGAGGDDRIDGGAGADVMAGGLGDDVFVVDNIGDRIKERDGEGIDTVETSVDYTLPGLQIERLVVTGGGAVNVTGNAIGNIITGNGAANSINGAGGDDRIDGGGGADVMAGGLGDDIFVVDQAGDRIKERVGQGNDTVESTISFTLFGLEVEKLVLTGSSALDGTGNAFDNVLTGNGAANSLLGYDGADELRGGGGNDMLRGMAGNDMLEGGDGADRFYFDADLGANNVDTIADFEAGVDAIYLRRAKFDGIGPAGTLSADAFAIGDHATDASDRILYDAATGALYFDPDGSGAATAIRFAMLGSGLSLSSSDFISF